MVILSGVFFSLFLICCPVQLIHKCQFCQLLEFRKNLVVLCNVNSLWLWTSHEGIKHTWVVLIVSIFYFSNCTIIGLIGHCGGGDGPLQTMMLIVSVCNFT